MPDAGAIQEARDVSEMAVKRQRSGKGKYIKGSEHMDWGMRNRLSRLIGRGRALLFPADRPRLLPGADALPGAAGRDDRDLLAYCDALFVTRGVLRSCVDPDSETPIILRVSGGTSVVGKDLANEVITTSIEEIIRLNVSAVGVSVFIGSEYEKQTLSNLSAMVNECENYGIPVMAVTAVGKELEKRDARYLASAAASAPSWARGWSRPTGARTSRRWSNGLPGAGGHGRRAPVRDRARGLRVRPRRHAEGGHRRQPGPQRLAEPVPGRHGQGPARGHPRERHPEGSA